MKKSEKKAPRSPGKVLTAGTVSVLLILIISILTLMFYPLYCDSLGPNREILTKYSITVDGEELCYYEIDSIENDGLIAALIKGGKLDATDADGKYNIYRWKLAPDSDTEYLLLEHVDQFTETLDKSGAVHNDRLIITKIREDGDSAN